MPEDAPAGAGEMRPDSFAPIRPIEPADSINTRSASSSRTRRRAASPSSETRSSRPAQTPEDESNAVRSKANDDSASHAPAGGGARTGDSVAAASGRPTWRDIPVDPVEVPLDESVRRAANVTDVTDREVKNPEVKNLAAKNPDVKNPEVKNSKVVTLEGATTRSRRGLFQRLTGSKTPLETPEVNQSVCRVDPTDRRLLDLELPNLDGKIVTYKDLAADLVLLDFWGSWCKECKTSIPHLSELQAKYGEKRLRVIGIACEHGATMAARQASAAKAVRDQRINYPVLVTNMDGACPVQQGMQIHFYPTMLLLDRSGRIIHREEGATDATLARIDRAIARVLK
jgi:thiol-disulfide isomerase/thioredoxin